MAAEYQLCAIDLDETLLGPDHQISEGNIAAIRVAINRGLQVVIASGRMHEATQKYASLLGLTGPIISYNGALVKVPATGDEWLHLKTPAPLAAEVMEFCAANGYQLNFYYQGLIYTEADTPWLQLYHGRTGSPYKVQPGLASAMRGLQPTKLLIVDTPDRTNALLPIFREKYAGSLYVTKTTDEYLEFMPIEANKGAALEIVASKLGIGVSETIAIGDSFNDIPMVEWAGLGLAVGNAKPELKAVADRVIGRYDEDGVGRALLELTE